MSTLVIDQLGLPREIEHELNRLSATYELKKVADKGNNGFLIFAHNRVLARDVALKFYFWADGVRKHIEPSALAEVQSPAIIDVLEASIVGKEWALFITPFYKNGDLDKVRDSRRFGLHEAATMVEKLLNGVAALHARRYLHRDLKPENILVTDDFEPLIADFGSVRRISEGSDQVPGSGHSLLYRPPESFDTGLYDRRGDVYQCGMVLFQLLGGRLEYEGHFYLSSEERVAYSEEHDVVRKSRMVDDAIARRATSGALCDLTTLPFYVPARVRRVVAKAIHPDPQQRFQQASDMLSVLRLARQRSANWIQTHDGAVALGVGKRYRVHPLDAGRFCVQMDSGNGWRRVPGTKGDSQAKQLRLIESRCVRSN